MNTSTDLIIHLPGLQFLYSVVRQFGFAYYDVILIGLPYK
jgi:hypothetical protein